MSVYFPQPCPIPYHIIHPQFFLFFGKKLHNALWKIAHIGRKYFLPLIQAQALYFIFYGEHSMNHSLILKIFSLHPPGNMRRAWHWFEAGYNETKQLYHSTNCISLYFWYIENIRYEIIGTQPLGNDFFFWQAELMWRTSRANVVIQYISSVNGGCCNICTGCALLCCTAAFQQKG